MHQLELVVLSFPNRAVFLLFAPFGAPPELDPIGIFLDLGIRHNAFPGDHLSKLWEVDRGSEGFGKSGLGSHKTETKTEIRSARKLTIPDKRSCWVGARRGT
jgi:hypothetical protein